MKKELSRIASKSPQYTGNIPHIIGIGASAGGLEPIEQFLANVPVASGMAFIVVQHLGPTYKGILVELLQRVTPMTILQAGNRMKVKPDTVYVIPPNKDLSIMDGTLYLLDPTEPRGMHLPIDFFFRVLAEDQHERAVGVILSGMGSDGTLGLRSIKENGGLTLAQDPASAKFPSMPQSTIDADVVDIVGAVDELPRKIIEHLSATHVKENAAGSRMLVPNTLDEIVALLRHRSGNDFSLYKKNTLLRRIERRMGIYQFHTLDDYAGYLKENPQELDLLFKELLIGVTSFFRDPAVWEQLKSEVIPALLANHPQGKALRAWVIPCSTGEEAYSLAMIFREVLEETRPNAWFTLRIFATDLDQDAVTRARQGVYSPSIADNVSPERLDRFFIREQNTYRINKEIREMVTFAPQNVLTDPPFTKLDILCCRNLLIYLGPQLQAKLLPLFHYALSPSGVLVLGNAETIGSFSGLFEPINSRARLYQRVNHPAQRSAVEFPTKFARVEQTILKEQKAVSTIDNLQSQADQVLLQNFSPSAVLVNRDGDIVYISGRTGKFLEPAAGKANWNIYAMARDGLRHELAGALKKVVREQGQMSLTGLQVRTPGLEAQTVDITLQMLEKPPGLRGMIMIVFTEVPTPVQKKTGENVVLNASQVDALESANEEIQTLREEMQTSHEELTSANEELQSTNEELQSTNEELTTSKEEMQSLNEELQTVNSELQSKVDDLSTVSNDMKNLLNSTDIATVFLDNDLNVRRFTTQATRIFKLIAGDVGRSLSDIVHDLQYPQLQEDIKEVLHTLNFRESQATTNDGRWYKVRIMPYRTTENMIHGIVLTFSDITAAKELEAKLREKIESISNKDN